MCIVHVNIPSFAVEVERTLSPRLRRRPVLIAATHSPRAVVLDASLEAYQAGAHKGMPVALARRLCRDAVVLPPRPELWQRASDAVREQLGRFSPMVERQAGGHFYLDLSGTARLFGPPLNAAWRIQQALREATALVGTLGVAANKLVSKVATRLDKPDGLREVPAGTEAAFLGPLPVELLPFVGPATLARLRRLGLRRIRDITELPSDLLTAAFGAAGRELLDHARGIDPTPVLPEGAARTVACSETLTPDTNDAGLLRARVLALVEQAAGALRRKKLTAAGLRLTLVHADGIECTRRSGVAPTRFELDLYGPALALLDRALVRRVRVRRIVFELTHFGEVGPQRLLFEPRESDALAGAIDRIRDRFGPRAITSAATL